MKKISLHLSAISMCMFVATTGYAKKIDKYGVSVNVQNAAGQVPEFILATAGVTCTSSLSVRETEKIRDKKGGESDYTFKSDGQFTLTMLGQPQSNLVVPVNPENKDPQISVDVFENCSGSAPVPSTCTTRKGDTYPCMQRETVNMPMSWSCKVPASQFPANKGDRRGIACNPPNDMAYFNAFSNNPIHAVVLNYMHQKQITINMEHQGREYHYQKYNCPNNVSVENIDPNLATIIRLSGGIKTGAFATNDIDYRFSINGGHEEHKDRQDGITNFDILYCKRSAGEPIDLKLGAHYGSKDVSAQEAVFDSRDPYGSRTLRYKVPGSLWGSVESSVDAQVITGTSIK